MVGAPLSALAAAALAAASSLFIALVQNRDLKKCHKKSRHQWSFEETIEVASSNKCYGIERNSKQNHISLYKYKLKISKNLLHGFGKKTVFLLEKRTPCGYLGHHPSHF